MCTGSSHAGGPPKILQVRGGYLKEVRNHHVRGAWTGGTGTGRMLSNFLNFIFHGPPGLSTVDFMILLE
jgi:hypothetical protein